MEDHELGDTGRSCSKLDTFLEPVTVNLPEPSNLAVPDSLLYSFAPEPNAGAMAGGDMVQSAQRSALDDCDSSSDKGPLGVLEIPKIDRPGSEQERIASAYLRDKYFVLNLVPFLRLKKSSWSCEKLRPNHQISSPMRTSVLYLRPRQYSRATSFMHPMHSAGCQISINHVGQNGRERAYILPDPSIAAAAAVRPRNLLLGCQTSLGKP